MNPPITPSGSAPRAGRYRLLRCVGTGGMAEIWKARADGPAGFEKTVAVKRILPSLGKQDEFVRLFVQEAKLVARLEHPNIVSVFDFGVTDDSAYFIAMEYVAGQNLSEILHRLEASEARLASDIGVYVAAEAAAGLAHAHSPSARSRPCVIHRDVSPQNILVSYSGSVMVTDFGIAKVTQQFSARAQTLSMKGKLSYMSPEQISGEPIDRRTDLFSLGVVLTQLITGDKLFPHDAPGKAMDAIRSFDPDSCELLQRIEPELRAILARMLAPDANDRFEDAVRVETELKSYLGAQRMLLARRSLVTLMQNMFEDDFRRELAEESDGLPVVLPHDDKPTPDPTRSLEREEREALLPDTSYQRTLKQKIAVPRQPLRREAMGLGWSWWIPLVLLAASVTVAVVVFYRI